MPPQVLESSGVFVGKFNQSFQGAGEGADRQKKTLHVYNPWIPDALSGEALCWVKCWEQDALRNWMQILKCVRICGCCQTNRGHYFVILAGRENRPRSTKKIVGGWSNFILQGITSSTSCANSHQFRRKHRHTGHMEAGYFASIYTYDLQHCFAFLLTLQPG